mmetsp:Transcript_22339/g.24856  ORF Transcript_22339/g.24856 Transcript_22339/m.24856 type:complete len:207 (+) Transcript_22339:708-1328(+)
MFHEVALDWINSLFEYLPVFFARASICTGPGQLSRVFWAVRARHRHQQRASACAHHDPSRLGRYLDRNVQSGVPQTDHTHSLVPERVRAAVALRVRHFPGECGLAPKLRRLGLDVQSSAHRDGIERRLVLFSRRTCGTNPPPRALRVPAWDWNHTRDSPIERDEVGESIALRISVVVGDDRGMMGVVTCLESRREGKVTEAHHGGG